MLSCRTPRTSLELKNCRGAEPWPSLCFCVILVSVDEALAHRKFWFSHLGRGSTNHFHPRWVSELQLGQGTWAKTLTSSQNCIIYPSSLLPHQSLSWICLFFFWASSVSSVLSNYRWFSFITKNLVGPNKTDKK